MAPNPDDVPSPDDVASPHGGDWLETERAALSRVTLSPNAQAVGRVEEIADGVARVSGLPEARLGELLRFEGGRMGYALSLEPHAINAAIFDEAERSAWDRSSRRPAKSRVCRWARTARPRRRSARASARSRRSDCRGGLSSDRAAGAGDHRPGAGVGAGRHGRARGRRALRFGARPARAHHRRPRHGQDGDRRRYDPQPEALRHDLRLCRRRPARDGGRARGRGGEGARRPGALRLCRRVRRRLGGVAMDRPVRGLHDRRIFPRSRDSMPWSSWTISPSTPRPIASLRSSPASRPAARPFRATFFTSMRGYSNARRSSRPSLAEGR